MNPERYLVLGTKMEVKILLNLIDGSVAPSEVPGLSLSQQSSKVSYSMLSIRNQSFHVHVLSPVPTKGIYHRHVVEAVQVNCLTTVRMMLIA